MEYVTTCQVSQDLMAEGGWEMRKRETAKVGGGGGVFRGAGQASGAQADKNQTLALQSSDILKGFSVCLSLKRREGDGGGQEEERGKRQTQRSVSRR